ncbi:hypothetical protein BN13_1130005 [Nostocoides jenkinsii Ben 74]|uniref:Uncharacterized protein n=1 Tax=Nostocoides jenkinsii Ben 74 TaxID=1193518 RepID=A0A077MA21_9MICO|nr:hypothetical protein BN13_1130005 [Tetrasphaera jenkinsii Ben 74]
MLAQAPRARDASPHAARDRQKRASVSRGCTKAFLSKSNREQARQATTPVCGGFCPA